MVVDEYVPSVSAPNYVKVNRLEGPWRNSTGAVAISAPLFQQWARCPDGSVVKEPGLEVDTVHMSLTPYKRFYPAATWCAFFSCAQTIF